MKGLSWRKIMTVFKNMNYFFLQIKSNIFSFSIVTTDSSTQFIFTDLFWNSFFLSSFKMKQKKNELQELLNTTQFKFYFISEYLSYGPIPVTQRPDLVMANPLSTNSHIPTQIGR